MKVSDDGIALIKKYEGCRLTAYKALPSETYYTIGYGHYGADVKPDMVITQAYAEALLRLDLDRFCGYVDALVSFAYNCGAGNLKKLVSNRSNAEIANAILLYRKAGGKVLSGLVKRRQDERALFLKG